MFGLWRGGAAAAAAADTSARSNAAALARASECVRGALRGGAACAEGSEVRCASADDIVMDAVMQHTRLGATLGMPNMADVEAATNHVVALFEAAAAAAASHGLEKEVHDSGGGNGLEGGTVEPADANASANASATATANTAINATLGVPSTATQEAVKRARLRADYVGPVVACMPDVFWLPERKVYVLVPEARSVAALLGEAARDYAATRASSIIGGLVRRAEAHVREHGPAMLFAVMELAPGEWEGAGAGSSVQGGAAAAQPTQRGGPQDSLRGAAVAVAEFCYRLGWSLLIESGRRRELAPRDTATLLARLQVERVRAHAA